MARGAGWASRGLLGSLGLAAGILAWEVLSALVPGGFVPGPVRVLARFFELLPELLGQHAAASLGRIGAALAFALLAAVPAGLALGRISAVDRLFSPVAYLLYPAPKIAFLPVIMLLFGLGDVSKAFVVFLVLFFQLLVAVRDGSRAIPEPYLTTFRSLGGSRLQALRFVILPALLPTLLSSVRIGTGTALAVLFFAETFGTTRGLGWFVMESWMRMAYVDLFAGILCLGFVGLALFLAIDLLERRVCRWQGKA
jgi:ABC-type nitrate/sulfonate/bicarbonate transport system permease component